MRLPALLGALLLLPAPAASTAEPLPGRLSGIGQNLSTSAAGLVVTESAPSWQWPLAPRPPVLRGFDPPPEPWLSGHRGVDLGAAHDGATVTSPADGTVSFVGVVVDRPVVTVDHGNGLRSSFEPVESALPEGSMVAKGQSIGTALPGHCGTIPCVHWGVRRGEDYVNPLQFVTDLRPSILLPLSGSP